MIEIYTQFGRVAERISLADCLSVKGAEQARARLLELERTTGRPHWMRLV